MTFSRKKCARVIGVVLIALGFAASSGLQATGAAQESGPVYSVEGAWYGMTTIPGVPTTPTFDTFTSNARRPGVEGSFLCTLPTAMAGNYTPSAHGNWVRVGINTYAYTAMRAITNGATPIGWAKFFGTITVLSDSELTGTINVQLYDLNMTETSPQFTGTLERHRVEIKFEE